MSPIDLGFEICDAHHHLWDLDAVQYPWLLAPKGTQRFFGDPTKIQDNYLVDNFRVDIGELPVTNSIHIQVGAALGQHMTETAWVQSQIDKAYVTKTTLLPTAMVAYANLESNNIEEILNEIELFQSVRGVRQIIGRSPEEDKDTGSNQLLFSKNWKNGLRELERRSMSFDLQLIPSQMDKAFELFSEFNELPVALCHAGSPWFLNKRYQSSQSMSLWKEGLYRLASLPNVSCKISGLSMFNREWSHQDIKLITETVLDAFGIERCMFGSNFPVDKLHTRYQDIWLTYLDLTHHLPHEQKCQIFGTNCLDFYRIS